MISEQRTFIRVLLTRWRRKPAGIDVERNYVTVTLCIDRWLWLRCHTRRFSLLGNATCECLITGTSCDDAFQVGGSSCYKVHKNEAVNWFTAVNRCLSMNASLAAFTDDVRRNFPGSLLSVNTPAWIGLLKSWWTWPSLSKLTVTYPFLIFRFAALLLNLRNASFYHSKKFWSSFLMFKIAAVRLIRFSKTKRLT